MFLELSLAARDLRCRSKGWTAWAYPMPKADMINLIHHAINSGVTFLDTSTSDFYGPHTNEILVGKTLKGVDRERVQIATKFGILTVDGEMKFQGDPAYARGA